MGEKASSTETVNDFTIKVGIYSIELCIPIE